MKAIEAQDSAFLNQFTHENHIPLAMPDDKVSAEVPAPVGEDFSEALRCKGVKAKKTVALMCRRSLQASCDIERANGNDLFAQIDDLASKRRIAEPRKKMAHRIRLLGKKGAHGDYSDIDDAITDKDAEDAITLMRHYLGRVYILPAQLKWRSVTKVGSH